MGDSNERQLLHRREVEGITGLGASSPATDPQRNAGWFGIARRPACVPLPSASTAPGAHDTVEPGRERRAVTASSRPDMPRGVDPLLSIRELSAWLGVSPSTIRRWVGAGAMPAPVVLGGHGREGHSQTHRWLQSEIQAWLDDCRGDASVAPGVGP